MKVIFLDIDGVLNSAVYDRQRTEKDGNIDKTRLAIVKELVNKTGARIVLSSSWRNHWEKNFDECDDVGKEIITDFASAGLEIYDKTPKFGYLDRSDEIRMWLNENPDVDAFVIFDDNGYGWDELSNNLIQTNYQIGRALEEKHIRKALVILKRSY